MNATEDPYCERLEDEVMRLRGLNTELLTTLKELRDDETMPGRFLPIIATLIAKAEAQK